MNNNKMEKFLKSGKISDYLDYKINKKSRNEETSMEFIAKGEKNANTRRDCYKDNQISRNI